MTIRKLLDKMWEYIDLNMPSNTASVIHLMFADKQKRDFAVNNDNDKRNAMYIVLGHGYSTFKHDHLKTIYCILPREVATQEIEKYRDTEDPYLYKYRLPEREFNSILNSLPVSIDDTIEVCKAHYVQSGYRWEDIDVWKEKVAEILTSWSDLK